MFIFREENDFVPYAPPLSTVINNGRYASQFQSDQFGRENQREMINFRKSDVIDKNSGGKSSQNNFMALLNEHPEEELFKMIDEISNLSDDVPSKGLKSVTPKSENFKQALSTNFQPPAMKHRDVIEIVTPKYVANVNISPILNRAKDLAASISLTQKAGQSYGTFVNPVDPKDGKNTKEVQALPKNPKERLDDEFDRNVSKDIIQLPALKREDGSANFPAKRMDDMWSWGGGMFSSFDDGIGDNVDEAEKIRIPEQDVGEQETENEQKEENEIMSRSEDETMQPSTSNNIAYTNYIPRHEPAPYSNLIGKIYLIPFSDLKHFFFYRPKAV